MLSTRPDDASAARSDRTVKVLVVHRQLLLAQVLRTSLSALDRDLAISVATDVGHPRARDAWFDVLIAEELLSPLGRRWRDRPDGAPVLLALGDPEHAATAASVAAAVRGGARAWVPADAEPALVLEAIHTIMAGQLWLPPDHVTTILRQVAGPRVLPVSDLRRQALQPVGVRP
jgi:hypothetical protein